MKTIGEIKGHICFKNKTDQGGQGGAPDIISFYKDEIQHQIEDTICHIYIGEIFCGFLHYYPDIKMIWEGKYNLGQGDKGYNLIGRPKRFGCHKVYDFFW